MECPCKGCEVRSMGCHSVCKLYSAWRKEHEAIRGKRKEEAALDVYFKKPEHWFDHV